MENLTPFQVWQYEKYGNILPDIYLPHSLDEDEVRQSQC